MRTSTRTRLALALLALVGLGFSPCGALEKDSPSKAEAKAQHPEACRSLNQLAPTLMEAARSEKLVGIRRILDELGQPSQGGGTPPINQVMQALFVAIHAFAADPPEPGATPDAPCNDAISLPLHQTNRMCDLRRAIDLYVHQGKASRALHGFDPVVAGVLAYIVGKAPAATGPHFEIAANLETMCTGTGRCDAHDTFDLVQGITGYLTPDRAERTLGHLETLIDDPALASLFTALAPPDGGDNGSSAAGFEAITNQLICSILAIDLTTPAGRQNYFKNIQDLLDGASTGGLGVYSFIDQAQPDRDGGVDYALPDGGHVTSHLYWEVNAVVGDLKDMMNPDMAEPILQPLQKAMDCASVQGASTCGKVLRPGFVPMIYHLGFEAHVVGIDQIFAGANELVTIDAQSSNPGMVMYLLHDIAATLNRDPEALDALTNLCHVAFQVERPCDDGKGNDCPALPLEYFPASHAYANHLDGCVNGLGANYRAPNDTCRANAELAVPEIANLFNQGITDEALCAIDTLMFGCAGGSQPACEPPQSLDFDGGP